MRKRASYFISISLLGGIFISPLAAADRSAGSPPSWMTGKIPEGYRFDYFRGMGVDATSLGDAQKRALDDLLTGEALARRGCRTSADIILSDTSVEATGAMSGQEGTSSKFIENVTIHCESGRPLPLKLAADHYSHENGLYTYRLLMRTPKDYPRPYPNEDKPGAVVRSAIVPGWGQLYKKQYAAAALLFPAFVASAGVAGFGYDRYLYYRRGEADAVKLADIKWYHDRSHASRAVFFVSLGIGVGMYVYNLIHAATAENPLLFE